MEGAVDRTVEFEDLRLAESLSLCLLELLIADKFLTVGPATMVDVLEVRSGPEGPNGGLSNGHGESPRGRMRSSRSNCFKISSMPLSMTARTRLYYKSVRRRNLRDLADVVEGNAGCVWVWVYDKNGARKYVRFQEIQLKLSRRC